jgi:hypothetical protein
MKTKATKYKGAVARLVEEGFAIHQKLLILNEEFKQIKQRLKLHAGARPNEHVPLLDKDSEGEQWIVFGDGCECRVVFPDAKVKIDFDPGESDFLTIRSLTGDHFKALFRKVTLYRPTEKKTFRGQVKSLLGPKASEQLLELCSSENEPKIIFKARPLDKEDRR